MTKNEAAEELERENDMLRAANTAGNDLKIPDIPLGDQPAYPAGPYGQQTSSGMTVRQLLIKDFMCALIPFMYPSGLVEKMFIAAEGMAAEYLKNVK